MLSLRRPFGSESMVSDPYFEISRLEKDMNRMVRNLSSSLPQGGMSSELMTWNPVMDIKTTDREMMINMELPGVRKEDVNIELDKVIYFGCFYRTFYKNFLIFSQNISRDY